MLTTPSHRRLVIDALKDINDEKRNCYRLIGGVLVGRTVGEILVVLEKNLVNVSVLNTQCVLHTLCLNAETFVF